MNSGNLIFLLVVVGGLFAMFFMHRGGHAHGGTGHAGRGQGGMGGCGGHNHGGSSPDEDREEGKKPIPAQPGSHGHDHEPTATGSGYDDS
jgi:hypothetical protein